MQKVLYHIKSFNKNNKHWEKWEKPWLLGDRKKFPCKHNFPVRMWQKEKLYSHCPPPHHGRLTYTNQDSKRHSQCTVPPILTTAPAQPCQQTRGKASPRGLPIRFPWSKWHPWPKLSAKGTASGFSLVVRQEGAIKVCPHLSLWYIQQGKKRRTQSWSLKFCFPVKKKKKKSGVGVVIHPEWFLRNCILPASKFWFCFQHCCFVCRSSQVKSLSVTRELLLLSAVLQLCPWSICDGDPRSKLASRLAIPHKLCLIEYGGRATDDDSLHQPQASTFMSTSTCAST